MKLRIKDNSFRFRITLSELEELRTEGFVSCESLASRQEMCFTYSVQHDPQIRESCLQVQSFAMVLQLSSRDLDNLLKPEEEGVYLKSEWEGEDGSVCRAITFIEKDRPSSHCDKPDSWIYEDSHHKRGQ